MSGTLRHRLGVVLMITDDEWRELPALTAALCLMVFGAVLGFSAANALFMQHVGGEWLPETYLATAATMLICTPAFVWMTERTSRRTQALLTFGGSAAALAALPWFRAQIALWIYLVLTMAIFSFTSLVFWLIAADCYDPRQARRLFHVISAGGSVGAVLAGLGASWLAYRVSTHLLSLLWAAALVAAAGLILGSRALEHSPPPAPQGPGTLRQSLQAFAALRRVPVAPPLVWTTAIAVFIGWLINYQFNLSLADAHPHTHAFADYFAELAAAVSIAVLLAQLGLIGRIMGRLGLVGTMYLPAALLLGPTVILALQPNLVVATICRFLEQFCGLAIVSSCVDTLSAAIPGSRRAPVMALLRTVVTPLAMAGAGLLLMGERFLPAIVVRSSVPLLIVMWMIVLLGLRRRYLDTLISNLASSDEAVRLESLSALDRLTDAAVDRVLVQSLSSEQPEVAVFALELLREPGFERLAATVPPCLRSPSADIRAEAVRTLAACAPVELEPYLFPLLADADPVVRGAVMEALHRLLGHRSLGDALAQRLLLEGPARLAAEDRPELRAVLLCVLRRAGWTGVEEAIRAMHARQEVEWRHGAALALAAVDAEDPPPEVEMLLRDEDSEVRRAAARSLRGPFDGDTRALLVAMLREPSMVEAATTALSTCGPGGVALMRHTLQVETGIPARVAICEVLGRIGTPEAVDAVASGLRDRSARVRLAAARSLSRMQIPGSAGDLSEPLQATADHLACTALQLRILEGQDMPQYALLRDELALQLEESRSALSILVSLAAWGKDEDSAHTLLEHPTEDRERGISLELVENALQGTARKTVLAIIEAQDLEALARVDVAASVRWRGMSPAQLVDELTLNEDVWVSQCARWARQHEEVADMLTPMEKILFLRQIELFKGIPGRDLAVIAEMAREETCPRGQIIFEEGGPGDALYLIIEGSIAVLSSGRIIEIMGVRECFGEMSILSGEPRSATIQALDETRVLTISRTDFRQLIVRYPHIAFPIFEILARRIKKTTQQLASSKA